MDSKVLLYNGKDYKRVNDSDSVTYTELMNYEKDSSVDGWSFNASYLRYLIGDRNYSVLEKCGFRDMKVMVTHNKTGNLYFLKNIAVGCTNGDEESLNAIYENDFGTIFVREVSEFFKKFTVCD